MNRNQLVGLRNNLVNLVLPVLVLIVANYVVDQRTETGQSGWLSLSPDTSQYLAMSEGREALAPFVYRPLVPLLASWLPGMPLDAMRVVTYVSIVLAFALMAWTLVRLARVRAVVAWLAIVMLMTSTRSLLLVQNPYLTDAPGLLWMSVMWAAFLGNWPARFGLAGVAGVLTREDAIFGAFGFFGSRRGVAGIIVLLSVFAAFLVPRLLHPAAPQFIGTGQLLQWEYYAKAYFAFGFLWGFAMLGFWFASRDELKLLVPYCLCAFGGALVSTLFAVDTTRVFLPMLPLLALGTALALERLVARRWLLVAMVATAAANVLLAMPNVLFAGSGEQTNHLESWYAKLAIPIALHQAIGLVLVGVAARAVRGQPEFVRPLLTDREHTTTPRPDSTSA